MRRRGSLLLTAFVTAVYVFILAPILVVVLVAFDPAVNFRFPPQAFSLRWFESFFTSENYMRAFLEVSLPIALATAVVAGLFGTISALALYQGRRRSLRVLEGWYMMPLLVPEILIAISWYILAAQFEFTASRLMITVGHVVISTPFVIRTVSAGLARMDVRLREAASSLGAGPLETFFRVTLPLLKSSIMSGTILAFLISFSDINLSLFLAGPGVTTLPVEVFAQMEFATDPTIAAASTLQILLVASLLFLLHRAFAKV